jgi:hypothetical protein
VGADLSGAGVRPAAGVLTGLLAGRPQRPKVGLSAIRGQLGFIQKDEVESFKRLAGRFGLLLGLHAAAGLRFWKGSFWAGLYSWWLMWTFNPGTLRRKRFRDVALSDLWMTRAVMIERYASGNSSGGLGEEGRLSQPRE